MPQRTIEKFLGGLNVSQHPTQIADDACQRLENMEVRPTNIGNNLTYFALTSRFSYQRLHTDSLSMIPYNLVEFVVRGIGSTVYASGVGGSINDASFAGAYTGTLINATYVVSIDATNAAGTPETFKWTVNGVAGASGVVINGTAQTLNFGLTIDFATTGSTTKHVVNDAWSVNVSPNGTKYLVVGGYSTFSSDFKVRYLEDGKTTTTLISSQGAGTLANSSICSFMLFNQNLYYTDGQLAWRRWNGVNDVASGFTTVTKYGILHKNKAFYLWDVTNNRPNRIWSSNTGDPETVPAANNYNIGDYSDGLVIGVEDGERIILIKEKSLWCFYLAPTFSDSQILSGALFKGSISPLGIVSDKSFGTFLYGTQGMLSVAGLSAQPTLLQIYNQLRGFQNSRAALMVNEDQLLISTLSSSGQAYNNRIYTLDLLDEDNPRVFQWNANLNLFCQNRGLLTFGNKLKAIEYAGGTIAYIVELDAVASTAEASIDCIAQTKDFMMFSKDHEPLVQTVNHVIVNFNAPNTVKDLVVDVMADGVSVASASYTPTVTGFNKRIFYFQPHIARGYRISYKFTHTQVATNATRFAIYGFSDDFNLELRVDQT